MCLPRSPAIGNTLAETLLCAADTS
jgi:hypothetical protein